MVCLGPDHEQDIKSRRVVEKNKIKESCAAQFKIRAAYIP